MKDDKPILADEERTLLKLMEEGKKEGRMTKKEQESFKLWLTKRSTLKR